MSQYAVHKLWFYYNDETYEHSNVLASCIGVYNSYEAAQKAQKAADRMALINMESSDWIRDLAGFNYNADYQNFVENLTNYARSQGWDKYLIKNDKGTYSEVIPPPDITDAQMDEVLKISHASFHRIVEYVEAKESIYIKFNYDFWGKTVFDHLKTAGHIEPRNTPEKGFYLVHTPPRGRKSAKFADYKTAVTRAGALTLASIREFPENNAFARMYLEDLALNMQMLIAFLNNCRTIQLHKEIVTAENINAIQKILKKFKSTITKNKGEYFYSILFDKALILDVEELNGCFELLHKKPFSIIRIITEINGETVLNHNPESIQF